MCLADLGSRGAAFQLEMFEEVGVLFLTRSNIAQAELKKIHSKIRNLCGNNLRQIMAKIYRPGLFAKLVGIMKYLIAQAVGLQIMSDKHFANKLKFYSGFRFCYLGKNFEVILVMWLQTCRLL
ncbi:MAG: hypothetical protein ABJA66_01945 [Actinomycetota bacterium]